VFGIRPVPVPAKTRTRVPAHMRTGTLFDGGGSKVGTGMGEWVGGRGGRGWADRASVWVGMSVRGRSPFGWAGALVVMDHGWSWVGGRRHECVGGCGRW
jgi:hypothetical protein